MIKNQQLHTEHDTLHPTQVSISKKKDLNTEDKQMKIWIMCTQEY